MKTQKEKDIDKLYRLENKFRTLLIRLLDDKQAKQLIDLHNEIIEQEILVEKFCNE